MLSQLVQRHERQMATDEANPSLLRKRTDSVMVRYSGSVVLAGTGWRGIINGRDSNEHECGHHEMHRAPGRIRQDECE